MEENDLTADHNSNKMPGLPSWVINNIERLNFVSDFEQYACSPPETTGFLVNHVDNLDFSEASKSSNSLLTTSHPEEKRCTLPVETGGKNDFEKFSLVKNASPVSTAVTQLIDTLKHEDFVSSPDSTPCVTPEPSPLPRRKLSGQADSVQSNPGRWFYLGHPKKKYNMKGQLLNISGNNANGQNGSSKSDESLKKVKNPVDVKKEKIKLAISNFDLNAISPSSW